MAYHDAVAKLPTLCLCLLAISLNGCASWGTHIESVTVCTRGFANDHEWSRSRWAGPSGRELMQRYPSFVFEGRASRPQKPSTLWFRNRVTGDVASCSMHSCETGRCVWRVRLFSKQANQWSLRSEYDLGQPRKLTGQQ